MSTPSYLDFGGLPSHTASPFKRSRLMTENQRPTPGTPDAEADYTWYDPNDETASITSDTSNWPTTSTVADPSHTSMTAVTSPSMTPHSQGTSMKRCADSPLKAILFKRASHGLEGLQEILVNALKQEKSWLGGETVDYFLQMAAFCQPSFTTITSLMLKHARAKDTPEHFSVSQMLIDARNGKSVNNVLVAVNVANQHWLSVLLNCSEATAHVHDSGPLPKPSSDAQQTVINHLNVLKTFLPEELGDGTVDVGQCPLQQDGYNCGVFTIVNSFFLAAGIPLPESLDGRLWRHLLLAMTTESSLASILPQYVMSVDRSLGDIIAAVDTAAAQNGPPSPSSIAAHYLVRVNTVSEMYAKRCSDYEQEGSSIVL